ncbi:MAG: DUF819 family protein [Acidobacteriota bacterium]
MVEITVCAVICALVFWSTSQGWAKKFYKIVPSVVLIYYLPTLASTFGLLPSQAPAYDWMRDWLLPFSLFILMVTSDIRAILGIGRKAIFMMLFGTLGVILGGPVALILFQAWLPEDAWKILAALSGSWIGGGGNFAAIKEAVGASDSMVGPIIIVDTAVGYTWTGILLFMSRHEKWFDRINRTDTTALQELNSRFNRLEQENRKVSSVSDILGILAIGLLGVLVCGYIGDRIDALIGPLLEAKAPDLAAVFSRFTWMVILITTIGIALSFTRLRETGSRGGTSMAYAALYLFLASLGAKADVLGLLDAPVFLLAGIVWIMVHVAVIFTAARILRAPLFLVAVGSQANIGGVATAPIVAAAYYKSLAPIGVLMGILGYLIGNYAGLLTAYLLKLVAY